MTFEKYWCGTEKLKVLPKMTIRLLPSSLYDSIRKQLMKLKAEETVEMADIAIEKVNRRSEKCTDRFMRKNLKSERS